MAVALLCLGLTLLGTLPTQAQDSSRTLIPSPPLSKVPLQPDFQHDQFQGKWYVIGVAGNAFQKGRGRDTMYTDTYELKDDQSFNVTATLLRGQVCDHWIRTFVPGDQPGEFTLGNRSSYRLIQSYVVRVTATNYDQFAIVFFKKTTRNRVYFKTNLYGRTKELSPELKQRFVNFAKSLGLSDDNINFLEPIAKCIDG
ncbi:neutrophil gelatinase-associated lipocalin-like [Octodon degus]|uniref:Neutrophil gelatinase-associated lipocalin-like n=1 Tax=Octodon degus TaxID=10160 RepID=A0A6P6DBM5_OCTDE|nr:neutrophil gelatinase-associated lipocalin-like [Octodon degus]XP_023557430.1 neutrophil gelatinase-associated lipocalin-like [Octodon degus]XP_023557431.1 neutrophil gelatinase-associated lipocalin-like [Octodon degus]